MRALSYVKQRNKTLPVNRLTRAAYFACWIVMALLATLVAAQSMRYFILSPESAAPPLLLAMVTERWIIFPLHAGGGIIALAAGVWNFLRGVRERRLNLHRWLGRIYLVGVTVGGLSGLSLAFTSKGGLTAHFGFGLLAVMWLGTAFFAYRRIRQYDVEAHRQWMIRNYALTFAAVTLRLWLPLLMIAGYEFADVYAAVAWLAWVPNLIVAEMICSRDRKDAPKEIDNIASGKSPLKAT